MKQKLMTRNFVLLIAGQASSLTGNYILRLALSMYVLELTGSAAVFAGILSLSIAPAILLSPFGGMLADRANRRTVMAVLDLLSGLFVLAAAIVLNRGNAILAVSVLLILLSILGAFETPTVQACVPQLQSGDNMIRANAVISQTASIAALAAPMLGGVFYAAVGLKPVMWASVACFFLTAALECLIQLEACPNPLRGPLKSMVRRDISESLHFLVKEQPGILKLLLLAAVSRFFVMGAAVVGLPYIIRNVLGLGARYYGAAESAMALAVLVGSAAAGLLTGTLKIRRLSVVLAAIGICMILGGAAFLCPFSKVSVYLLFVAAFCGMQAAINLFSIFAVSLIQQRTPNHLLGKVMAYTSALTMCVQPAGQLVYGFWFDGFQNAVFLVLIPTGAVVCAIGLLSAGFFSKMQREQEGIL